MSVSLCAHLRAGAAQPFVWGHADCCLFPADWVRARTGIDPAAPLRGRYGTAFAAHRHIARRGGFLTMVRDLMAAAGFQETEAPAPGDVGVIETDQGPSFAVRTRTGWATKGPAGITCAPFRALAAWAV